MNKVLKSILTSVVLVSLVGAIGCSGNSSKAKSEGNGDGNEIKKDEIVSEVKNYVYPLPTSFEIAEMMNRIGAAYILTLSNDPISVDKYFTEKAKALNLGVYSADLSYASTYNQKQQTIDFLNASRRLIEELDIAEAVDVDIVEKIEANENNKEALVELISNSFNETYSYLNENNRGGVAMLVVAGSYIEGLYIATHISEDTYNNKEMVSIIMKQKEPLDKLVSILQKFEGDANVKEITEDVVRLQQRYEGVGLNSITEGQLQGISEEVAAIRNKIVQ